MYGTDETDQCERIKLDRPDRIGEQPPEKKNVYTDGSLKNPASQRLAVAGLGAWWPGRGGI